MISNIEFAIFAVLQVSPRNIPLFYIIISFQRKSINGEAFNARALAQHRLMQPLYLK
jgi:hypothetical protein